MYIAQLCPLARRQPQDTRRPKIADIPTNNSIEKLPPPPLLVAGPGVGTGVAAGVALLESAEAELVPIALLAVTVKV
jgi:hypothetical protein